LAEPSWTTETPGSSETVEAAPVRDPVDRTRRTYETIAEDYHERTRDERGLLSIMDRFLDRLPPTPVVLDAGRGTGRDARFLGDRQTRAVGLDFSGEQLRVAADHAPDARLVQGDLRTLPLADGSVDGVRACASSLHLPRGDLPSSLGELRRVLRPGGTTFCSLKRGDETAVTHAYDTEGGRYVVRYQPEPFGEMLREAGFAVDELDGSDDWFHAVARRPEADL
jgi:ubiquinone/menaquinone biosynthesis C-methylase UbiE